MSEKLTKEMIDALIKEELAKAEQKRLDEFKVSVNSNIDDLIKGLNVAKGDFYDAAKAAGFDRSASGAKSAAKQLGDLGGTSKTHIDKGDFAAAKAKGSGDSLYKFGDYVQKKTTDTDIQKDWSGTTPATGPWGPGGKYVAVPSKATPLYNAIKKALADYVADTNKADAQAALTAYAARYTAQGYTKKAPKAIAGTTGKTWVDVINAAIGGASVSPELADQALKDLAKALTAYEPQDVSRPEVSTVGAEKAQFSQDAIYAFDGLFVGAKTLNQRVKKINELSEAMVRGSTKELDDLFNKGGTGNDKRAFLNGIVCMDYIAKFAKEIDHGAGAYFFEAFTALISGGEVAGKSGKAGDFTLAMDDGSTGSGSSKYLQKTSSRQAVSGFQQDVPVQYIGAFKRKGTGAVSTSGTSAPEEIVIIDFYLFQITLSSVDQRDPTKNTVDASQTTSGLDTKFVLDGTTVDIKFNYSALTPTRIYLATKKNESFKDALEDQVKKSDQDLQDSYNLFKNYFAETRKADVQVKSYLGSGELNKGTEALRAITAADQQMVEMFNLLRPAGKGVTGTGTGRELKENKMEQLDLMIENMVKQFIKGNLND